MSWLGWIYSLALVVMSLYGANMLVLMLLAVRAWQRERQAAVMPRLAEPAPRPEAWPRLLVQLPLFNERYVAERVIDAATRLEYPAGRLFIQVLDDSTDDTTAIARARVAYHQARGVAITLCHRTNRSGFKAGALAEGLAADESGAEVVAVFDADFAPEPDFLLRTVPVLAADPALAVVQGRWEHLNHAESALTGAIAVGLDAHFAVEQMARNRYGLLMNFNGSAGLWRRVAIDDAGGWQGDTLAEDLDLSYRAQLRGWRFAYLPEVAAPAELPATILAVKRQQRRWAKGTAQVLRKLAPRLLRAPVSPMRKLQGLLHIGGYLPHALMIVTLLLSLPLVLWGHGRLPFSLGVLGLAGFGPVLMGLAGQLLLRPDWARRVRFYPVLVLVGIGLAFNNCQAIAEAVWPRAQTGVFERTPKGGQGRAPVYALRLDWTTWAEAFLAFYALVTAVLALDLAPALAPFNFIYVAGFAYTAALGFAQSDRLAQRRARLAQARQSAIEL